MNWLRAIAERLASPDANKTNTTNRRLGVTLAEVAISIVIVSMTALSVTLIVINTTRVNAWNERAAEATQIAERILEDAASAIVTGDIPTDCPATSSATETGEKTTYQTELTITAKSLDLNTGQYSTNCNATDLFELDVTVTWDGDQTVNLTTLISDDATASPHPVFRDFTVNDQSTFLTDACYDGDEPITVIIEWDIIGTADQADAIVLEYTDHNGEPHTQNLDRAGNITREITTTTDFTITARNIMGTEVKQTRTFAIYEPPTIVTLEYSPNPTIEGVPTTLIWNVTGADSGIVFIDNEVVRARDSREVTATDGTTAALEARPGTQEGGCASTAQTKEPLTVLPLRIESFTSDRDAITKGDSATLSWTTNHPINTQYHRIDITTDTSPDIINPSDATTTITPPRTTIYTLSIIEIATDRTIDTATLDIEVVARPEINAFNVTPTSVCGDDPITIEWDVTHATSLMLEPEPPRIDLSDLGTTTTTTLERDTDLYLVATNSIGDSVESDDRIFVQHTKRPTVVFTGEPPSMSAGDIFILTWRVEHADTVTINDTPVAAEGTWFLSPSDTREYTLTASVNEGACENVTASRTITIDPGAFTAITATPPRITIGETSTLNWSLSSSFDPLLHRFELVPSGRDLESDTATEVTPATVGTHTYSIVMYDRYSTQPLTEGIDGIEANREDRELARSDKITVEVLEIPVIDTFTSSVPFVCGETPVVFTWETRHADHVRINGGAQLPASTSSNPAPSGNLTITRDTPTLTLAAFNEVGYSTDSDPLTVRYYELPNISFTRDRNITLGDSTTLRWSLEHVTDVKLDGERVEFSGSRVVEPMETTTYTLEYRNGECDWQTASVEVEVVPVSIDGFSTDRSNITRGDTTDLRWELSASFDPDIHELVLESERVALPEGQRDQTRNASTAVSPVPPYERYRLTIRDRNRMRELDTTDWLTITVDEAPAITEFSVTPLSVCGPNDATVTWDTIHSTNVLLNNQNVTPNQPGSDTTRIERDTNFTLVAENHLGATDTRSLNVQYADYPSISAQLNTDTIPAGGSVILQWEAQGADSILINDQPHPSSGELTITPQASSNIIIIATKDNGSGPGDACVTTKTLSVTVEPVTIDHITTTPNPITEGEPSNLQWSFDGPYDPTIHTLTLTSSDDAPLDVTTRNDHALPIEPTTSRDYTLTLTTPDDRVLDTKTTRITVIAAPAIERFSIDPPRICAGDNATLTWSTNQATTLNLNGQATNDIIDGTDSVNPSTTTTYVLEASNPLGYTTYNHRTLHVTPQPTATLTLERSSIRAGESTTLSWSAEHADQVVLDGAVVPTNGSITINPLTSSTYTLTAHSAGCGSVTHTATLTVESISIDAYALEPSAITLGDNATLSWSLGGAYSPDLHTLELRPTRATVTGSSAVISPTATTSYRLAIRDTLGRDVAISEARTLDVQAPPTITSFTIDQPDLCGPHGNVTLTWTTTGATSVALHAENGNGAEPIIVDPNGSRTIPIEADTRFTLTASNSLSTSISRSQDVTLHPAPTIDATITPDTITQGQSATLTWSTNGSTLTINNEPATTTGTRTITPKANSAYRLTATRPAGNTTCNTTSAYYPTVSTPSITSFTSDHDTLTPDTPSTTLNWTLDHFDPNHHTITLYPLGEPQDDTSHHITPTTSTRYWLELRTHAGELIERSNKLLISIEDQPTITTFTATPITSCGPTTVTLNWSTNNASHVLLGDQEHPAQHTLERVINRTTTFGLIAIDALQQHGQHARLLPTDVTGSSGQTEQRTVIVHPATDGRLDASSTTIEAGHSVTLEWESSGANRVTLNGEPVEHNSSRVVTPRQSTTYELTLEGACGTIKRAVTINVTPTRVATLTSTRDHITRGDSVTLNWVIDNLDPSHTATLEPDNIVITEASGSLRVTPSDTTRYAISIRDQLQREVHRASLGVPVSVHEAPSIVAFAAQPLSVCGSDTTSLSWITEHASSLTLDGVNRNNIHTGSVTRQLSNSTNFQLQASNPAGDSVTRSVSVHHAPATGATLSADRTTITRGDSVTLNWNSNNAHTITLNGHQHDAQGSINVSPERTTTYTLTAQGVCGTITRSVTIDVKDARIISFHSDHSNLRSGQSTTLRWTLSANYDPTIHQLILTTTPHDNEPSNSEHTTNVTNRTIVTPHSNVSYTLTLYDQHGRLIDAAADAVTISIDKTPTVIAFNADPASTCDDQAATLTWYAINSDTLTLNDANVSLQGSATRTITSTTTYTLTPSRNGINGPTRTLTIEHNPTTTPTLNSDRTTITPGDSATLTWDLSDANLTPNDTLTLNGTHVEPTGSLTITPTTTQTYTLNLRTSNGCDSHSSVTINVQNVTLGELTSSHDRIARGDTITLTLDPITNFDPTRHQLYLNNHGPLDPNDPNVTLTNGSERSLSVSLKPDASRQYQLLARDLKQPNRTLARSNSVHISVANEPSILDFSVEPLTLCGPGNARLTWRTSNATTITLNGLDVTEHAGTTTRYLDTNNTFTLTASNPYGSITSSATITINPLPTLELSAFPRTRTAGESSLIEWRASIHTHTLTLNNNDVTTTGTLTDRNHHTITYTLEASTLECATPITRSVTIDTDPVEILTFNSDRNHITDTETTMLRWSLSDSFNPTIHTLTLEPLNLDVTHRTSLPVTPGEATTYQLRITDPAGDTITTSAPHAIAVEGFPVINSFTSDLVRACDPTDITFTWATQNAIKVLLNDETDTLQPLNSGSTTRTNTTTTTYAIRAINPLGVNVTSDPITVQYADKPTIDFTTNHTRITDGQPLTLTWNTQHSTTTTLNGQPIDHNGELVLHPRETTTYTIHASNTDNGAACATTTSITVTVDPVSITNFTSDRDTITNTTLEYRWFTTNGASPTTQAGFDALFEATPTGTGPHWGTIHWTNIEQRPNYLTRATDFAWEVSGYLYAPESGDYTFHTSSGDGNQLTINDTIVTSHYGSRPFGAGESSAPITLEQGWHSFRYRMHQSSGEAGASVSWTPPSSSTSSVIPGDAYAPAANETNLAWSLTPNYDPELHDLAIVEVTARGIAPFQGPSSISDLTSLTTYGWAFPWNGLTFRLELRRQHDHSLIDARDLTISAIESPLITAFSAADLTLCTPQNTHLTFTTLNAASLTLITNDTTTTPLAVDATSHDIAPLNPTNYELIASNNLGVTSTHRLFIDTRPQQELELTLTPDTITAGATSQLEWNTRNTTATTINGIPVPATGTRDEHPLTTRNYTLRAEQTYCDPVTLTRTLTIEPISVTSFAADPSAITLGESTNLTWSLSNNYDPTLHSFRIRGHALGLDILNNTTGTAVTPTSTGEHFYRLEVLDNRDQRIVVADTTLTVIAPPVIDHFSANPTSICVYPGQDALVDTTLSWSARDAVRLELNGEPIAPPRSLTSGSIQQSLTSTSEYQLEAFNELGYSVTSDPVTVTHITATDPTFTANTERITEGDSVTLAWEAEGSSVSIDGFGPVTSSGSLTVAPRSTSTYTLRSTTDGCDTIVRQITVTVDQVSITSFTTDRNDTTFTDPERQSANLSWTISNYNPTLHTLTLDPIDRDITDLTTTTITPESTESYHLTLRDRQTPARVLAQSNTITVTVNKAPAISDFDASHAHVCGSTDVEFSWRTLHASTLTLNGIPINPISNGSVTRTITNTNAGDWTLRATNPAGTSDNRTRTIEYHEPIQATLNSDHTTISRGESVTLHWDVQHATSVTLNGASVPASGNHTFTPTSNTTYELIATKQHCPTITRTIDVTVNQVTIDSLTFTGDTDNNGSVPQDSTINLEWALNDAYKPSAHRLELSNTSDAPQLNDITGTTHTTDLARTTTWTLRLYDRLNPPTLLDSATITTHVQPIITTFTSTPRVCSTNPITTIDWHTTHATNLNIHPNIGPITTPTGSRQHTINNSTTFTLTATNDLSSNDTRTTHTTYVTQPDITAFTTSTHNPIVGTNYTLEWDARSGNPENVTLDGEVVNPNDSIILTAPTTIGARRTHTLIASSDSCDSITKKVTITAQAADIATLTIEPTTITIGQSATIAWTYSDNHDPNDYRLELLPTNQGGTSDASDATSRTVTPDSVGVITYTANLYTRRGDRTDPVSSRTVNLTVVRPPIIDSFTATPATVCESNPNSTLSWTTTDATNRTINQGIGSVNANGTHKVSVTDTTTYTLSASNAAETTVTSTATVTLLANPSISDLTTSTTHPIVGQPYTINWTLGNDTDRVFLDGEPQPPGATSATRTATTTGPITHTLTPNNIGCDGINSTISVDAITTTTQPAPPTTTITGPQRLTIEWTPPTNTGNSPITSYTLERHAGNGTWTAIGGEINAATQIYNDISVIAGTSYRYRITANNAAGASTPSQSSDAITAINLPNAPNTCSLTAGNAHIAVHWDSVDSTTTAPVSGYNIYRDNELVRTQTSTNWTNIDLDNGTTYRFSAQSYNSAGESSITDCGETTPYAPPAPPSTCELQPGNTEITVTWDAVTGTNAAPLTLYEIQRDGDTLHTTTSTSWTNTELTNGTSYTYNVRSEGAGGPSTWTSCGQATPIEPPAAPTTCTLERGNAQITVSWASVSSTPAAPFTRYHVQRDGDTVHTTTSTSWTDTGLTNGTSYVYTVSSEGPAGPSTNLTDCGNATPIDTPNTPTTPTVTQQAGNQHQLAWTHSATDARPVTNFTIEWQRTDTSATGTLTSTTTSATYTGVNGVSYRYQVQANNGVGSSAYSDYSTASVAIDIPNAPDDPTVEQEAANQHRVSWEHEATTGRPVTSFTIEWRSSTDETGELNSTTTSATHTGVNGVSYRYRVRANNGVGSSAYSDYSTASVGIGAPAAPASCSLVAGNAAITVSWERVSGTAAAPVTQYRVSRDADSVRIQPGTSWTDDGLTNGRSYSYTVRAEGPGGESAYTSCGSAIPVAPQRR